VKRLYLFSLQSCSKRQGWEGRKVLDLPVVDLPYKMLPCLFSIFCFLRCGCDHLGVHRKLCEPKDASNYVFLLLTPSLSMKGKEKRIFGIFPDPFPRRNPNTSREVWNQIDFLFSLWSRLSQRSFVKGNTMRQRRAVKDIPSGRGTSVELKYSIIEK